MSEFISETALRSMLQDIAKLKERVAHLEHQDPILGGYIVRCYRSTAQSINNGAWTAISFDTEQFDPYNLHDNSVNPTRITLPTVAKYLCVGQANFVSSVAGAVRGVSVRRNGVSYLGAYYVAPIGGGNETAMPTSVIIETTAANDYIELCVYQDSGGALNTATFGSQNPALAIYRLP
jgi:hypothetical protein